MRVLFEAQDALGAGTEVTHEFFAVDHRKHLGAAVDAFERRKAKRLVGGSDRRDEGEKKTSEP